MKWSQFNRLLFSEKIGYFLLNTRMLSLITINEDSYKTLMKVQKFPDDANILLNKEDYNYLLKNKILVKDGEDEAYINQLKYRRNLKSFGTQFLSLVIGLCLGSRCRLHPVRF